MSQHKVTIISCNEQTSVHFGDTLRYTAAAISVKPPISVGSAFKHAVLGRDPINVHVSEVLSTGDETIILAESKRAGTHNERAMHIDTIAQNIGRLVNSPEEVMEMLEAEPFATPSYPHPA